MLLSKIKVGSDFSTRHKRKKNKDLIQFENSMYYKSIENKMLLKVNTFQNSEC